MRPVNEPGHKQRGQRPAWDSPCLGPWAHAPPREQEAQTSSDSVTCVPPVSTGFSPFLGRGAGAGGTLLHCGCVAALAGQGGHLRLCLEQGTGQPSSSMDTATTVLKKTTALIKTIPSCCPGTKAKPRRNRVRKRCYSCSEPRRGPAVVTGQVQGTGRHQGAERSPRVPPNAGQGAPCSRTAGPGSVRAGGRQPPRGGRGGGRVCGHGATVLPGRVRGRGTGTACHGRVLAVPSPLFLLRLSGSRPGSAFPGRLPHPP